MSLWASPEDLHQYAYQSDHVEIFRQRATWFIPQETPSMALWWLPEGEMPSISDARRRLDLLAQAGPTLDAFTFRSAFEAPDLD
jgi:hypothetical protein